MGGMRNALVGELRIVGLGEEWAVEWEDEEWGEGLLTWRWGLGGGLWEGVICWGLC